MVYRSDTVGAGSVRSVAETDADRATGDALPGCCDRNCVARGRVFGALLQCPEGELILTAQGFARPDGRLPILTGVRLIFAPLSAFESEPLGLSLLVSLASLVLTCSPA